MRLEKLFYNNRNLSDFAVFLGQKTVIRGKLFLGAFCHKVSLYF
jgi:hypothetical protein